MPIDRSRPVYGALDLASSTGAAAGNLFAPPECETWVLRHYGEEEAPERGLRFTMLRARLFAWCAFYNPVLVFIEQPMDARQMHTMGTPIETQLLLTGLYAIAEQVMHELDIPVRRYERQDVLRHFTGVRRYKVKEDGKRACVARCKQLGWHVEGFDQADAAALLDFGCARMKPNAWAVAGMDRPLPVIDERMFPNEPTRQGNRRRPRRLGKGSDLFGKR